MISICRLKSLFQFRFGFLQFSRFFSYSKIECATFEISKLKHMETTLKIAIYIHAFFGGIGLLAGFASVIFTKGSPKHKISGKIFSIGMITSSLISLPICWLPKHENIFLFLIGIFTIYLVLSGNRVLLFKKKTQANFTDKLISGTLLIGAIAMVVLGSLYLSQQQNAGILFLFFGIISLIMAIRDFRFFRNIEKSKVVRFHIGKMTGAFAASITAFLVAGMKLNGLIYWILPSLLAGIFIAYWIKKVKKAKIVL